MPPNIAVAKVYGIILFSRAGGWLVTDLHDLLRVAIMDWVV